MTFVQKVFDTVREEHNELIERLNEHKTTITNVIELMREEKQKILETLGKAKSTAVFTRIIQTHPEASEHREEETEMAIKDEKEN